MGQVESILAEIRESVRDTLDDLDVQSVIQAGTGKQTIGLSYEADGPDRAKLLAARIKKELEIRLHNLLCPHRILMQMVSGSSKPVLLKEWVALTSVAMECCPLPGKWLCTPSQQDETFENTLRISLVLWVEPKAPLN